MLELHFRISTCPDLCVLVVVLQNLNNVNSCRYTLERAIAVHAPTAPQNRGGVWPISSQRSGCCSASALPTWRPCCTGQQLLREPHRVGHVLQLHVPWAEPGSSRTSLIGTPFSTGLHCKKAKPCSCAAALASVPSHALPLKHTCERHAYDLNPAHAPCCSAGPCQGKQGWDLTGQTVQACTASLMCGAPRRITHVPEIRFYTITAP